MINMITRTSTGRGRGPQKVAANLMKGLDGIGYPYVVNRDLNATARLWIHNDTDALAWLGSSRAKAVVGPNLYVLPRDVPAATTFGDALYILPGPGSVRVWRALGFERCDLAYWPVGIDTDQFQPSATPADGRVLVYHKHRNPEELTRILAELDRLGVEHDLIVFGEYDEERYKAALEGCPFVVWHGRNESQGIALQEAMACDVPILVCDIQRLDEERSPYDYGPEAGSLPGTAVPYFDERCGIRIRDLDALPAALEEMLERRGEFRPRDFVVEKLSLEGQARAFVALWEKWDLTFEGGVEERLTNDRPLSAPLLQRAARFGTRLKRAVGRRLERT